MLPDMTYFEKVRNIIATVLGVDKNIITENLTMEDIPEWDSMGNMAIISALEDQLRLEIPIEDLFELNSVTSLVKEVEKLS